MTAPVWVFGASGGIGIATVAQLRAGGQRVIGFSRSAVGADAFALDLTDPGSIVVALQSARDLAGEPGGVVISVAAKAFGPFLTLPDQDWRRAFDVKLFGTLDLLRHIAPALLARGTGRIVLVTGRGTNPPARHLPGAGINAALNLILQGLARDWAAQGVTINAVAPGPVRGDRLAAMTSGPAGETAGVTPEEVAGTIAFLLSPAASGLSGSVLVVDRGGMRTPDPAGGAGGSG